MEYTRPTSLDGALALVSNGRAFEFVAGGTDLMIRRMQGTRADVSLIDLSGIAELHTVERFEDGIAIGAGVTLASVIAHPLVGQGWPAVAAAARAIASPVIRESATVGGNLLCENRCVYFDQSEFWREAVGYCLKCGGDVCIATGGTKSCYSVFISDLAPVFVCAGGRAEIVDERGPSTIAVEELYSGDGAAPRTLSPRAILKRVLLPAPGGPIYFRKLRPRASVDFTNLTVAMIRRDGEYVVAASGIGPGPVVVRASEKTAAADLVVRALKGSRAIDNLPYTRVYRRTMLGELINEGMKAVA